MTRPEGSAVSTFRRLHVEGLLILPNVWDACSARLVESLGASALATTSAAVAWSHGYADGNFLPVPSLLATVREIVRVTRVPLSVDVEGGYTSDPAEVAETVVAVADAGGVGINVEDGTGDPAALCAKIEHIRAATQRAGVDVFINARTDVFLRGLAPTERLIDETVARAERYRDAGADGIFVPGVIAPADIEALTSRVALPLNVLARKGLPAAAALRGLGVRRLSAGAALAEVTLAHIAALAAGFLKDGASEAVMKGAMAYPEVNALLAAGAAAAPPPLPR